MRSVDIPVAAEGMLADFAQAGAIGWSGVHLARTLGRLVGEHRPEVLLAVALCLRAQEAGQRFRRTGDRERWRRRRNRR